MPKTIKYVLQSLNRGEYLGKGGVDAALAEIRQQLLKCEPPFNVVTRDMVSRGEIKRVINEYTANIEKRLG